MAVVASVKDHSRSARCLSVAPRGALMAVADDLGRVLLLDVKLLTIVRLWKVRRGGWVEFTCM